LKRLTVLEGGGVEVASVSLRLGRGASGFEVEGSVLGGKGAVVVVVAEGR
jgi:hypothetical protein